MLLSPIGFAVSVLVTTASIAQDLHIDHHHTRHLHKHGEKHAVSQEPGRFHTSRQSPVDLPLPSEEDAFFFVVYGDRTGGPAEGVSVLKDAVRDTNLLEPDFVFTVGDLIQGYNQTDAWMEQMFEYKSIMDELLCPWFPVAGNHDVYWRGPDGQRPTGEHDANYEMHFGPLWYAFEHKNSVFIALYTDEGDPETGEKTFREPACQKMSDEQFDWLNKMLEESADAEHVFLFLHHPRWLGGQYGDDWGRVHKALVKAGNVSAVFAGHIHRMRFDPKDGIEYVTLATVGGGQSHTVPEAGWIHHYNIVTVREGQIAHAAVPVGRVMDVRQITGELADEAAGLSRVRPGFSDSVSMGMDGACDETISVTVANPASHEIEVSITPASGDSRWAAWPDHDHAVIEGGASRAFQFRVRRQGDTLDSTFRPLEFALDMDMLASGHRYAIPPSVTELPLDLELTAPPRPGVEMVLDLASDGAYAAVADGLFEVSDGPLTVECWFNANAFNGRTGLVAKTENSDYGLFVTDGKPHFSIHLGGRYRVAEVADAVLATGRWQHIAGVFDGSEVRLYVDGELVDANAATGRRRTNRLPFLIGADVDGRGRPTSFFDGSVDEVRVSTVARYSGSRFVPERRHKADSDTALLFNMDGAIGRWLIGSSDQAARAVLGGGAALTGVE